MSYDFYKTLHLLGLISLFMGLGGSILVFSALPQGMRLKLSARLLIGSSHGLGLLLILLGGFGMLAKKNIVAFPYPPWIWIKIVLWLLLALLLTFIKRGRQLVFLWWFAVIAIGFFAIYAVLYMQKANLIAPSLSPL